MNEKAPPATDHDEEYVEEENLSFRFCEYESSQGKNTHHTYTYMFLTEPFTYVGVKKYT